MAAAKAIVARRLVAARGRSLSTLDVVVVRGQASTLVEGVAAKAVALTGTISFLHLDVKQARARKHRWLLTTEVCPQSNSLIAQDSQQQ